MHYLSKTKSRIREAYEKGYRVTEDGQVFGPKGKLAVRLYGRQKYPSFTFNKWPKVFGLPVHQLAAYCFYGDLYLCGNLHVRHLNANTLDNSKNNIVLGTPSENELDKTKESRVRVAKIARAAQGHRAKNAKLTDEQVQHIKELYSARKGRKFRNGTIKDLCEKLKITRTTIYDILSGKSYANG